MSFGNICARKHRTRSHASIQYCLMCHSRRLVRQILCCFQGPMHNAKTVPAVQVRWRIWDPAQVSRPVTNVKELNRTNDCLQFLSLTVSFNCNLLHSQPCCSWFEKKHRIFNCLMANCKLLLCLFTILIPIQSVFVLTVPTSLLSTMSSPLAWRSSERLGDSAPVAGVSVVSAGPAWQCSANSTKPKYFDINSETMHDSFQKIVWRYLTVS